MPSGPSFDIFRVEDDVPRWIKCLSGLDDARTAMRLLAARKPGKYFLWDARANQVVERVETPNFP